MIWISIFPDQSQLGQVTIPVVIALRSNSARLMTCPQFGQMCTLSQDCLAFSTPEFALIIDPRVLPYVRHPRPQATRCRCLFRAAANWQVSRPPVQTRQTIHAYSPESCG
jgi:hypothetical protein